MLQNCRKVRRKRYCIDKLKKHRDYGCIFQIAEKKSNYLGNRLWESLLVVLGSLNYNKQYLPLLKFTQAKFYQL